MKRIFGLPVIIYLFLLLNCIGSHYYQKYSPNALNFEIVNCPSVQLVTFGGMEYNISILGMDSARISGEGKVKKPGTYAWSDFQGDIPLDSIDLIQYYREKDGLKTAVIFGSTVALLTYFSPLYGASDGLTAEIEYPSGGGSCPFIYSWTGEEYVLDAEAISVALGKSMEMTTSSMLPHLQPENGEIKIRIANERPETHNINAVELWAIHSEKNAAPVMDSDNKIWPVYNPEKPILARDHHGKEIASSLQSEDDRFWESDLSQVLSETGFEDTIELVSRNSTNQSEGSIVVHAINTELSDAVFRYVGEFLGERNLEFVHAVENDPELVAVLRKWLESSTLKAFVWDVNNWQKAGFIYPEANAVPFTRLIRFQNPNPNSNTLRVRLTSLADVWKLDAVHVDWTPVEPLEVRSLELTSAAEETQKNIQSTLEFRDDQYQVLLPPQYVDLTFKSDKALPGHKVSYALSVSGYIYEWMSFPAERSANLISGMIPDDTKITYLTKLLKHKELFLPLVYAKWQEMKGDVK